MKILLVNPYPKDRPPVAPWPHLGLVLLAAGARAAGHEVRVADYAYSPRPRPSPPGSPVLRPTCAA